MNLKGKRMIMFDYGGVLAPEGFQLGILKMAQRFNMSFDEMYEIAGKKAGIGTGYTAGKVPEEVYWKTVSKLLNTDEDLTPCRDLILDNFQPRKDMVKLAERLSEKYMIGLFSDQTNWIYELDGKYGFLKHFSYKCISFEKGLTKQDDGFYRLPAGETGLNPDDILLVDDKPRVTGMAGRHGMRTLLFTTVKNCVDFFRRDAF